MALGNRARNDTVLLVLGGLGIASVVGLFVNDGLDVDGFAGASRLMGVVAMGLCIALGLLLRASQPVVATLLLVAGSAAPALAFYDKPPSYLLTAAIAAVAVSRLGRPSTATA